MNIDEYTIPEKNWNFPPQFRQGVSPTAMVTGLENIRQSLRILFSTAPGERVHRPDYGFSFNELVFEPASLSTRVLIENSIRRVVEQYEPRIYVDNVIVDDTDSMSGVWNIQLVYTILRDSTTDSLNFTWKL